MFERCIPSLQTALFLQVLFAQGFALHSCLMYKFSILKLAANGVEGSTESQAWLVVSAKQPHCRHHPRPVGLCWPCWSVQNDSSPSPAQHKRTLLLQLEVLKLKRILVCVTEQCQPPQSTTVQLWVLRNGVLNFSPS